MKLSDEIIIDLGSTSEIYDTNVESLIYLLQTNVGTITHAINPELVFVRRENNNLLTGWICGKDKGFYLKPQISIPTTGEGLNPYRSASCLVMRQLRNWNKDFPTGEFLEIPIQF